MSLRTRRGTALWASIFLVAAACTGGTQATPAPTTPAPPPTQAATEPPTEPVEPTPGEGTPAPTEPGESPAPTEPGETPAPTEPGETAAPPPDDIEGLLFNYVYEPEAGTPGGGVIISDWQRANQLNPYYSNAFANSQVYAATMRALAVVTSDGHWKADLAANLPRFSTDTIREDTEEGRCPFTPAEQARLDDDNPGNDPDPHQPTLGFEVDLDIKPGLLWSDGDDLTLADLRYTWQWVLDPAQSGIVTLGWEQIDSFDVAEDGLTATVHFCEPFAGYFGLLMGSAILPMHYMETIPIDQAITDSYPLSADIAGKPVSGPFRYVTASPDTIELEKNPNWLAGTDGRLAYLDRVTYRFYPNNKAGMIAGFLAGDVDVAVDLLQGDYDAISVVDPAIGRALLEPAWEYEHLDMNVSGEGPGQGHPALQDPVVRASMRGAIDPEALWNTVFPGQPFPADIVTCTNAPPGTYWRLPDDRALCPPFDVAAANAALDAAGYTDTNGDGVRNDPDGNELIFEHCTSDVAVRSLAADYMVNAFQQIGIQLNKNLVDSTTVFFASWNDVAPDEKCNLARGNYDTAEFAYVLSFDLFGNYYYSYHSEQIPTDENEGNGFNYLRYSDPDMDAALDTLASAIRPEDAIGAAYTVQELFVEQNPEIVLYYRASARGVAAELHNFFKNPGTSSDMWNIEDWFWTAP